MQRAKYKQIKRDYIYKKRFSKNLVPNKDYLNLKSNEKKYENKSWKKRDEEEGVAKKKF